MNRMRSMQLRPFLEILVMRLEQDYDSAAAAIMVIATVAVAALNPFMPRFVYNFIVPGVILVGGTPPYVSVMLKTNVLFDSFILSIAGALALFFRSVSFGAVAELSDGTMSGLVTMPGGRRAVFVSIVMSGTVVPYLLAAIPVAVAISLTAGIGTVSDFLFVIGVNFLPMMGLLTVTLGSGMITRRSGASMAYGVAYLLVLLAGVAVSFESGNGPMVLIMSMFVPSYAMNGAAVSVISGTVVNPVLLLQPGIEALGVGVLLAAGMIVNTAMLYALYHHWSKRADI